MATKKDSKKKSSTKSSSAGEGSVKPKQREKSSKASTRNNLTLPGVSAPSRGLGSYIEMNGQRLELVHHPTDFSVIGRSNTMSEAAVGAQTETRRLSANMARVRAKDTKSRDKIMDAVREETVAHHI